MGDEVDQMNCCRSLCFEKCIFALTLLSLTSIAACSQKRSTFLPSLTEEILRNAEYQSEWPAKGVAKLTDGKYQEEIVPGAASKLVIVIYPDLQAFGDLNFDGNPDASVVLATSGGGAGTFISLEAVINDEGAPKHIATALLGDRVQIKSIVIESGRITVNMLAHGPDDPMCCPTVEHTKKYRLEGDALIQMTR